MKRYAAKGCWPAGAGREVVGTGKCGALMKSAGKVSAGCGRKTVAGWSEMYGVTVLPAGAG